MTRNIFKKGITKLFLSYFFLVILPLIIVMSLVISIFIHNEEIKYKDTLTEDIKRLTVGIDTVLESAESISLQVSMLPVLNNILNNLNNAVISDFYQLNEDIKYYSYHNNLFHSFYIYFKADDRVLTTTETFFDRNEFYDKEVLNEALEKKEYKKWYSARYIKSNCYWPEGGMLITLARTIPVSSNTPSGALFINIKEYTFTNIVKNLLDRQYDFLITDSEGNIISSNKKEYVQKNLYNLNLRNNKDNNPQIYKTDLNNSIYYVVEKKSGINGWSYILLVPHKNFKALFDKTSKVLFIIYTCVLLIMIFAGLWFTTNISSKWRNILVKLGIYIHKAGLENAAGDEYMLVSNAVDKLVEDNIYIDSLVKQYIPVVRERLLFDLLLGNILSEEDLLSKHAYVGLTFNMNCFIAGAVTIIGMDEYADTDIEGGIRIYLKNLIETKFNEGFKAYCVLMDEEKHGIILNFDFEGNELDISTKNKIRAICSIINENIIEKGEVNAFFAFGPICRNKFKIADSFGAAKNNLEYKALSEDELILFSRENDNKPSYPTLLQKQLINGVLLAKSETVINAINNLFDEYVNSSQYSLTNLKGIISVMMSTVLGELWQDRNRIDIKSGLEFIAGISQCTNSSSLKNYLIKGLIELMKDSERAENEIDNSAVQISKVVRYIKENHTKDINVVDIAAFAGLNPKYLVKIFKKATGKGVLEYLTLLRMEKARKLMEDDRLSLKEISGMVGYYDVHSFIRFFKKHEGITPGEYRQNIVNASKTKKYQMFKNHQC